MIKRGVFSLLVLWGAAAANADLSAFISAVGFDEDANLDGGLGLGLRWGKSSSFIGGETSVMVARPNRELGGGEKEAATAIFYEGRLMVNIPLGLSIKPFANVGFGNIYLTSTDVPNDISTGTLGDAGEALGDAGDALEDAKKLNDAWSAISEAQSNRALSYGIGARYELVDKLDLRFDLRQYSVFSVKSLVAKALEQEVEDRLGVDVPGSLVEEETVQYNELSIGLNYRF